MGQILRNGIRYSIVGNATTSAAGLCPMLEGDTTKYLRSDGQWEVPPNPSIVTTASAGLCPQLTNVTTDYLRADGTWSAVPDPQVVTTSSDGLCPQLAGGTAKYLRADGTWTQPPDTNTTYGVTTTSNAGLAPKLNGSTANFLRGDGSWATPAYPTVNNGTLTIQRNGTNVTTFTANQSGNATANISVPTNTNQLTNGAGFITAASVGNGTLTIQKNGSNVATFTANQGGNTTANITVPTNNNQLTNGAGYITSDLRVRQNAIGSDDNNPYRVLLSGTADDTTRDEQVKKGGLYWSWKSKALYLGALTGGNYGFLHLAAPQQLHIAASAEEEYRLFLGVRDQMWGLSPVYHNHIKLGSPSFRWNQLYVVNANIDSSDRNVKKDIKDLDNHIVKDLIMDLKPVSYKFKDGESGRTHYGLIAQDVEETMNKLGISPLDFAGFCKDQKYETYKEEVIDEDGSVTEVPKEKPIEGEYIYGLRYGEFISPMIKVIQDQENRIESLESEVKELKDLVNKLLKK